ncbi:MAG: redoxin domain-containing protein [Terriglobales bacterium]|jgi:thiol-disulfide isomerase/thioredoxin
MNRFFNNVMLILVALSPYLGSAQATPSTLAIGSEAPVFSLMGTDGIIHRSTDWKGSSVLVIAFLCNHCTESQMYEPRLNRLAEAYASKGVTVVAVQSSNPKAFAEKDLAWSDVGESLDDMKERAEFRHFRFPYLYDGDTGSTALAFGASVAPSVFILDKERKLRYSGRIDDDPTEGPNTTHYAVAAIDSLLAGNPIAVTASVATGCSLRIGPNPSINEAPDSEPVSVSLATTAILGSLRHNPTGQLLLVNFYATWCGPCVSEFPDLMATNRMYRSRRFSFTTVSSNGPSERSEVLKFLQKMRATTDNLLYGSDDIYAMQDAFDPNLGATVPVTVLIAPNGEVLFHEQGEIDLMDIRRAILTNLPDDPAHLGSQKYWATK